MANNNAPTGFEARSIPGFPEPRTNMFSPLGYSIATGYGTSLFLGDPVKSTGTSDTKGRPGIEIAVAGPTLGVFAGVNYTNAAGERVFSRVWTASLAATDVEVLVFDHPHTIFSVQGDEDLVVGDIRSKADFISGTGNPLTGQSAYVLDSSNIGTGDALLILGLDPKTGNSFGNYARALVLFREHELCDTYTAS